MVNSKVMRSDSLLSKSQHPFGAHPEATAATTDVTVATTHVTVATTHVTAATTNISAAAAMEKLHQTSATATKKNANVVPDVARDAMHQHHAKVCVYVCMQICMCVYIYLYICTCICITRDAMHQHHAKVCVYVYVCMHI